MQQGSHANTSETRVSTQMHNSLRGVTLTDANDGHKRDFAHVPCVHCSALGNLGNVCPASWDILVR